MEEWRPRSPTSHFEGVPFNEKTFSQPELAQAAGNPLSHHLRKGAPGYLA
jgi:hypothetical protein